MGIRPNKINFGLSFEDSFLESKRDEENRRRREEEEEEEKKGMELFVYGLLDL